MLRMLKMIMKTGIVTENYAAKEARQGLRGALRLPEARCGDCLACVQACPSGSLQQTAQGIDWERRSCLFCGACVDACASGRIRHSDDVALAQRKSALDEAGGQLRQRVAAMFGRSLHVRHLDAGSCNACDFEMTALGGPLYDLQQYGIDFVASPRHADLLMVTGVVTRNLSQALLMTYEATPAPRLVMAVGACACSASVFPCGYAVVGPVDKLLPVDVYVPGCPPSPSALLHGLLQAVGKF